MGDIDGREREKKVHEVERAVNVNAAVLYKKK
jgi:hypothetical protein